MALGSFAGAIDPGTEHFRDFPAWVEQHLRPLVAQQRPQRLALFCTGGIRCEKATAHLLNQGFDNVLQLQGDPQLPRTGAGGREPLARRVLRVRPAGGPRPPAPAGDISRVPCLRPALAPADLALESYVAGVSCRHCIGRFSDADRERFAERQRQMGRAKASGETHIGRVMPCVGG